MNVSKTPEQRRNFISKTIEGLLALLLAVSLLFMMPMPALAYFDRGSVGVELGTNQVSMEAGETVDVSVTLTPASDEQTEGCGMPKCPQSCASTCVDERGQCRCAGKDLTTYYPTAVASSSNTGVAMAIYRAGRLSIFGRSAGTATINLKASLRQFTDSEATIDVTVSGNAKASDAMVVPSEFLEIPASAQVDADDRQAYVEKTAMGRAIRFVRIGGDADPEEVLASLLGTDGETNFWSGDTLHQPDYAINVLAENCTEAGVKQVAGHASNSFALDVATVPQGKLNQALSGMDSFISIDFVGGAPLPGTSTVYARSTGVFADDDPVSLYSYDESSKSFVEEDAEVQVVGGYVKFTTDTPKTYVVSNRDLVSEARSIVDAATPLSESEEDASMGTTLSWLLPVGIIVVAAVAVAAFVIVRSRRKVS